MVAHFECTVILIHTRLHDIFANKSHCFGCCCGIVIILCVLSAYLAHFCHCLVVVLCTHACCYCVSLFVAVAFGLGVHISVFAIALFAAQLLARICSIQDWGRIHLAPCQQIFLVQNPLPQSLLLHPQSLLLSPHRSLFLLNAYYRVGALECEGVHAYLCL